MQAFLHGVFVMSQGFFIFVTLRLELKRMKQNMSFMISLKIFEARAGLDSFSECFPTFPYLETLLRVTKELVQRSSLALLNSIVIKNLISSEGRATGFKSTVSQQVLRVQHLGHGDAVSESLIKGCEY